LADAKKLVCPHYVRIRVLSCLILQSTLRVGGSSPV
jgi:hypothetical protein